MARLSLTAHRKFRALARALGSVALARGSLELIWDSANAATDPVIGTERDIEEIAAWSGDRGALARALVETRFLDVGQEGLLAVHDFWDHCPHYVTQRAQRLARRSSVSHQAEILTVPNGAERRRTASTRDARTQPSPAQSSPAQTEHTHTSAAARPPVRATEPAPDPPGAGFEAFWEAYPRHEARAKALAVWRRLAPSAWLQDRLLAAIAEQRTWRAWREGFAPHAATWLAQQRWDDERPPEAHARGAPTSCAPASCAPAPWCDHDPPCHHQQEHIARTLRSARAAAAEVA
jgi:hypothetical protein